MDHTLVIVESPTKAKTIRKFLPSNYEVLASMGHVRDLPKGAAEIPAAVKKEKWSRIGVNTTEDFEPLYIVPKDKKKVVKELKDALKGATQLLLATDEDREGESISWHLLQILKPKIPTKRMVFHEITKKAINKALDQTREIDMELVQAQETRRILDRLFGYELSPLLWKKVAPRLSAGRVQSVSVRLLVRRERERRSFKKASYWGIKASLVKDNVTFETKLFSLNGQRISNGSDFDEQTGKLKLGNKSLIIGEEKVNDLLKTFSSEDWLVSKIEKKPSTRKPVPPFTTSTLQQEANRKLRLSARETMRCAQGLYERGFITYMRTDSVHLSEQATRAARECVSSMYGKEYLSNSPRQFNSTARNAQEAHEAIIPEAFILLGIVGTLLVDLAGEKTASKWAPIICYLSIGSSLLSLALQWSNPVESAFIGSFNSDNLAIAFRAIISLSTLISLLISWRYTEQSGSPIGEFAAIVLSATLGAMLLCGSTDLISVFISLETLSVASYLLSGYLKRDPRSSEAALKYLLVGSAAAAVYLYGSSFLYGLSGSTNLATIGLEIINKPSFITSLALVFVLSTVAFKIAAVPFHQWTPDVYEGSPTPVVAFLSVGSKTAGFAFAIRILSTTFSSFDEEWKLLFTILAILSMALGNVVALAQTSMKRMLAYSSIGQAGFVMIGIVSGTQDGLSAAVLYLAAYLFMNLGAFACVILFSLRTGSDRILDYSGLYQKDPLITLGLSLCLLSLGGLPPMLGFFGKIYLFFAGWANHQYLLVIVGLVTSVISIYYYISVIKMMVVKEPQEASEIVKSYPEINWGIVGLPPLRIALYTCVAVTALGGILSNPLFRLANTAVSETPFLQNIIAITNNIS